MAEQDDMPRLHDTVMMVNPGVGHGDAVWQEGRVVAVTSAAVTAEFPNDQGLPPTRVSITAAFAPTEFLIVRRAEADELDLARAEVAELRSRLVEIGSYASEQLSDRYGTPPERAFERIARLARQA